MTLPINALFYLGLFFMGLGLIMAALGPVPKEEQECNRCKVLEELLLKERQDSNNHPKVEKISILDGC